MPENVADNLASPTVPGDPAAIVASRLDAWHSIVETAVRSRPAAGAGDISITGVTDQDLDTYTYFPTPTERNEIGVRVAEAREVLGA